MNFLIMLLCLQIISFEPSDYFLESLNIESNISFYKKAQLNLSDLNKGDEYDGELCYFFNQDDKLKKIEVVIYRTMYKTKCLYYILRNNYILAIKEEYIYNKPYGLESWEITDTTNNYEIWNYNKNKINIVESNILEKNNEDLEQTFIDYENYTKYIDSMYIKTNNK